ncbi:MAG: transposase [Deltaproteobacteria bacterium]|nr:transposase [Deltaproteobacteria bacterium]
MSHRLRYAPPGPNGETLVEITHRCLAGMFLLRPSERLNAIVIGVLALAQRKYQVRVHACSYLSNHGHLLISAESQKQISSFMEFVGSNVAREVNRLHRWKTRFWARPYIGVPVVGGSEIQIQRLKYILSQGTKEGLVDSPLNWPGINSAKALANGQNLGGIWVDRTALHEARRKSPREKVHAMDFEEELTLELSPLPCWLDLTPEKRQGEIRALISDIEQEAAARHCRKGTRPLGRRAVLRQDPHHRVERLKTSPAPKVHAGNQELRKQFFQAYRLFTEAFRAAAKRLRLGDLSAEFPEGSFPPALPFVEAIQGLKPG